MSSLLLQIRKPKELLHEIISAQLFLCREAAILFIIDGVDTSVV
jgi:hypothetical protein